MAGEHDESRESQLDKSAGDALQRDDYREIHGSSESDPGICGAPTAGGTPCQIRVNSGQRCGKHQGNESQEEKTTSQTFDPLDLDEPESDDGLDDAPPPDEAPSVIGKAESPQTGPTESLDREFLMSQEEALEEEINTLKTALIRDPAGKHMVDMPVGQDPQNPHRMIMGKVPHREIVIPADQVVAYLGSVVRDRQAVHSRSVKIPRGNREGVVFDRFFWYPEKGKPNAKKWMRCAWIPNPLVRAGVIFEKKIDRRSRRGVAVLRRLPDTNKPAYMILGGKETDYRDLRRIFERTWIRAKMVDDEFSRDELSDMIGLFDMPAVEISL